MSARALAVWLPLLLLLLWLPGCCLLGGPSTVSGTEGETLSLQCWYEEKYKTYSKYWCKRTTWIPRCTNTVKTKDSDREVSRDRVSIHDHPEQLSFTVTLRNLSQEDTGSYWCGIRTPLLEGWDEIFEVEVSVLPGTTPAAKISTTTAGAPAAPPTGPAKDRPTQGPRSQEGQHKGQGPGLLTLLSLLVLLLLLLVGGSLLVWRILQRQVKAGEPPELSENLRQAAEQREPQYANLQLHTWAPREAPAPPGPADVEYSTVALPTKREEDLHYSTVLFNSQKQDSDTGRPQEEAEYSVVRKPGKTPNPPLPPS